MSANRHQLLPLGLIILTLPLPGAAAANDRGWQIRFHGVSVDTGEIVSTRQAGNQVTVAGDLGAGLAVGAEYRFSPRVGLGFGVLGALALDVGIRADLVSGDTLVAVDSLTFVPWTVGPTFHLTPASRADLYVGPLLAYVTYGDLFFEVGGENVGRLNLSDDFVLGAMAGLDLPIGEGGWTFSADLKYLDNSFVGRDSEGDPLGVDLDSTIFGLGFGYRF